MLLLSNDAVRIDIFPDEGAALGRYEALIGGAWVPIFQTSPRPDRQGVFARGCNLLVPFSNRISGGGFRHAGAFHRLERNTADPHPIHGNGFQLPWHVVEAAQDHAALRLESDGPGPFRYTAEVRYSIAGGTLRMELAVQNTAEVSLPFGVGFHPWFVRTPRTSLAMRTAGYWTETADHLPLAHVPTAGHAELDFSTANRLPAGFLNSAFTGWDGRVTIERPEDSVAIDLVASPPLRTLIVYSPSASADFVCVEPVSHSVDAHNRSEAGTAPPQVLAPGDRLTVEATISGRVAA